jgi:hypothetical protein
MNAGRKMPAKRYTEVRYENLIVRPKSTMRDLCGFLDLEFHPWMVQHHVDAKHQLHAAAEHARFHANSLKAVGSSERDWHSTMPDDQALILEAVAGPLLDRLGYARRFRGLPLSRRLEASCLLIHHRTRVVASRSKASLNRQLRQARQPRLSFGASLRDAAREDAAKKVDPRR